MNSVVASSLYHQNKAGRLQDRPATRGESTGRVFRRKFNNTFPVSRPNQTSPRRPTTHLHAQLAAAFPQPEQTPFLISLPHFLHGAHPQDWHIAKPLSLKRVSDHSPPGHTPFLYQGIRTAAEEKNQIFSGNRNSLRELEMHGVIWDANPGATL